MRNARPSSPLLFALLAACGADGPGPGNGGPGPSDPGAFAQPAGWADEVLLPSITDTDPADDVVAVDLEAKVAEVEYLPGKPATVWTYNGSVPGPLIRARVGDTLVVRFTNNLPEATTIHWHGLRVPATMDGAGTMANPIQPGATFEYRFELPDAGTYWYHPHVRSDVQLEKGLYGAIVVEDSAPPAMGDELVLVLDDVDLALDGTLRPPGSGGHMEQMIGRQGNTLLVNGRIAPTIRARAGRRQHWRMVNAANARYFHLGIPGYRITRVGGDAGLLPAPVELDSLLLVPGERAEIVITPDGSAGETIEVRNLAYERGHNTGDADPRTIFGVAIADLPAATPAAPPTSLGSVDRLPVDGTESVQSVTLSEAMSGMDMVFLINGEAWPNVTPLTATVGETQVWEVVNDSEMDHPFHLHGFFFQVLELNGSAPTTLEWKDTVNVPADATLRLAVRYDDRPGDWMFHCHILEHAELGMMGELQLAP